MSQVNVRLFGGAAEAFGASEVEADAVTDLAGLVDWLVQSGSGEREVDRGRLQEILDQCSFFVDGDHQRSLETPVPEGSRVDVLPPFAGG